MRQMSDDVQPGLLVLHGNRTELLGEAGVRLAGGDHRRPAGCEGPGLEFEPPSDLRPGPGRPQAFADVLAQRTQRASGLLERLSDQPADPKPGPDSI